MSFYIKQLNALVERDRARRQEQKEAEAQAARVRLKPLEERLAKLLSTIPADVQREGLSLSSLQSSLRGHRGGSCHSGALGGALRKLGFSRRRDWHGASSGFRALWYPAE